MEKLLVTILTLIGVGVVLAEAPICMDARNRCISRIGCSMALNNFQIACEKVKLGMVDRCTDICLRAVISLVTVDSNIGTDYLTCDCAGNEDCSLWKKRITMCSTDVLRALESLDNEDVISCSLARMLCDADTKCWTAMRYYEEFCSNLWIKELAEQEETLECSPKCNNSLSVLYKRTRASKLKNCLCDAADPFVDEDTCVRMRFNTQKFCFGEEPMGPIVVVDHDALIDTVKSEESLEKVTIGNTATRMSYSSRTSLAFSLTFTAILLTTIYEFR